MIIIGLSITSKQNATRAKPWREDAYYDLKVVNLVMAMVQTTFLLPWVKNLVAVCMAFPNRRKDIFLCRSYNSSYMAKIQVRPNGKG